jgi:hypothetical protein
MRHCTRGAYEFLVSEPPIRWCYRVQAVLCVLISLRTQYNLALGLLHLFLHATPYVVLDPTVQERRSVKSDVYEQ